MHWFKCLFIVFVHYKSMDIAAQEFFFPWDPVQNFHFLSCIIALLPHCNPCLIVYFLQRVLNISPRWSKMSKQRTPTNQKSGSFLCPYIVLFGIHGIVIFCCCPLTPFFNLCFLSIFVFGGPFNFNFGFLSKNLIVYVCCLYVLCWFLCPILSFPY